MIHGLHDDVFIQFGTYFAMVSMVSMFPTPMDPMGDPSQSSYEISIPSGKRLHNYGTSPCY